MKKHLFEFCNSSRGLCECGQPRDAKVHDEGPCVHNQLQRRRALDANANYVCGKCGALFNVAPYVEPPLPKPAPMFDGRKPWGLRDRQA